MNTSSRFSLITPPERDHKRKKKRGRPKKLQKLIDFWAFFGWIIWGARGEGKSVFGEWVAEQYHQNGFLVFDLYDSGDMESCFWAVRRCPNPVHPEQVPLMYNQKACPICGMKPETNHKILLVHPNAVTIKKCKDKNIATIRSAAGLEKIVRKAIREKRIITLASGLFDPIELDYLLTEWVMQWPVLNRDIFRTNAVFLIREAASVIFSKRRQRDSQKYLKVALETFYRRARHQRTVVIFDAQSDTSMDVEFRRIANRLILKRQNRNNMSTFVEKINNDITKTRKKLLGQGKNRQLVNAVRPDIPHLLPNQFYVIYPNGDYELKHNDMPGFYHKGEHDYFNDLVGLELHQPPVEFKLKNQLKSLGDVPKHLLLELNAAMDDAGMELEQRAYLLGREKSTIKPWVDEYFDLLDSEG